MTASRRAHERFERRLKVVVTAGDEPVNAISQNISLGGMLLVVPDSERFPYGTDVILEFNLPALKDSQDPKIGAVVRWSGNGTIGVQFKTLRAREVWALNQLFEDIKANG